MQITVKTNVEEAMKGLARINKKQIPFAAALGLTNTARRLADVEKRMIVKQLDRPTRFTLQGIRWQKANKADFKTGRLHSRVFIMDKQAEYLKLNITGGTRKANRSVIPVPTRNIKLNPFGNIPGKADKISKLLGKKNTFQATINGVAGIWQRPARGRRKRGGSGTIGKSGLKLLVAYETTTQYQPRFDFYGIAKRIVPKLIGPEMGKAIKRALQTSGGKG